MPEVHVIYNDDVALPVWHRWSVLMIYPDAATYIVTFAAKPTKKQVREAVQFIRSFAESAHTYKAKRK